MAATLPSFVRIDSSIELVPGVGPKTASILRNHNISTVRDLLYFFPRTWIDATKPALIPELPYGEMAVFSGQLSLITEGKTKKGLKFVKAQISDEAGSVDAMWFNMPYLRRTLKTDTLYYFYGQLKFWTGGQKVVMAPKILRDLSVIPIYKEIGAVPSYQLQKLIKPLLPLANNVVDFLPDDIRLEKSLAAESDAVIIMHQPENINQLALAEKRLGLDELLMMSAPALMAKRARKALTRKAFVINKPKLDSWIGNLPFKLTEDQATTIGEILDDLAKPQPMNRLVQGDVGSGKTVVGLAAAIEAHVNNEQTVWLAPTEVLANQHYATAQKLLAGQGLTVALWTRVSKNTTGLEKANVTDVVEADLIIGTHAVLSADNPVPRLGLLIIDEQHRFGVKQRAFLRRAAKEPPHLLSLTATPIPRTLNLLVYGDLQVSRISTKPVERKTVISRVVESTNRQKAYEFIDQHIDAGEQVFVVCPQIDAAEESGDTLFNSQTISVTEVFQSLAKQFPTRKIGLLHGKLKSKDKQTVMDQFRNGVLDILVSTTVIEVGVDVPNATIMMIEGAERFGLVQLHQLRGRIGRGTRQSFCLLFPSSEDKADNHRLKLIESTSDGFELAENDLKLRGPGEIIGEAQSGIPKFRFADLNNEDGIREAIELSDQLLDDEKFSAAVLAFWQSKHPE